jgi:hypothetical protein
MCMEACGQSIHVWQLAQGGRPGGVPKGDR